MISVVLATHNEEKNLPMCLDAVKDFADEIIIADGESTDKTVEIAKQYGARIIATTNKPNFHINKQMAMDKAKGELVLQLDADEIVDEELKKFITELHSKILKQVQDDGGKIEGDVSNLVLPAAWWVKRKNYFLGRFLTKGGQYPDPVIRLYRNGHARLPQKDVHEQMEVDGEIGWAEGHLLHYGTPSFTDYLSKWNRYTSFKAGQLAEQHAELSYFNTLKYMFALPTITFFSLLLRHRGYKDGFAGFVFALFSGLHHSVAYLKLWEKSQLKKDKTI